MDDNNSNKALEGQDKETGDSSTQKINNEQPTQRTNRLSDATTNSAQDPTPLIPHAAENKEKTSPVPREIMEANPASQPIIRELYPPISRATK